MHRKRKIEKKHYIIMAIIGLFAIIGILMYFVKEDRNPSKAEQFVQDGGRWIQKIMMTPVQFISDKIKEVKEKRNIYEKYKELEKKTDEMERIEAQNRELDSELQEMKSLLELNQTLVENTYINATVITRNIDAWKQTLIIDKGSKDGIEKNMAVITPKGMVGEVISTAQHTSTVKLLTSVDATHKLSIKILVDNSEIYGLLSYYDESLGHYKIEGIAENTEIKEGSTVITTGFGNRFPAGVLIGTVTSTHKDHFDFAQTIYVKPSVQFDAIRFVTVLKKA